ncbi:MAG: hypothetical protein HY342_10025, partial [Candidatus Lambdaproteobacteria bacterium]|nr:hypothetical protein [Candidatus Lambdaproteobacteria bacterium]
MRRPLSAALEYFVRGLDMLCRIGMALSAVALVAILTLVCAEVVARSVFDSSTLIAD